MENESIKRGEIYMVDLGQNAREGVQFGCRPCIIISNNIGNKFSASLLVVPLTTKIKNTKQITHTILEKGTANLKQESMVLAEQLQCINKKQLIHYIGTLNESELKRVEIITNLALGNEIETIDYEYIKNKITQIEKLIDLFVSTVDSSIREIINQLILEVDKYCKKFNVNSSIYLSRYTNDQKIA